MTLIKKGMKSNVPRRPTSNVGPEHIKRALQWMHNLSEQSHADHLRRMQSDADLQAERLRGLQARSRGEFPNGRTATAGSALVMETAAITGSGSGGGAKPKGKGKAKKAVSKKLQKMQLDDDSGAGGAGAGEAKPVTVSNGKIRRSKLPLRAVHILRQWFLQNKNFPYPDKNDQRRLAEAGGLTLKQTTNWFTNTRKRFWQPQTKPAGRGRNSRTTGTLREEEFAAHAAQEDKTAALEGEVVEVADEADEDGDTDMTPAAEAVAGAGAGTQAVSTKHA